MKIKFFLITFLLLIPFIASACTDSDNGINYYTKGITSGTNDAMLGGFIEVIDYCVGEVLYEYYCMDLSSANTTYNSVVAKIEFECPLCSDGKCTQCTSNCKYLSVCDESVSNGCGGICIRNTDGENCGTNKECRNGVCVSQKSGSSSSSKNEEPISISGEVINLNEENSNQQVINLEQKKDNSSNNFLLFVFGEIFFLLIMGVLILYISSKTKLVNF